MSSADAKICPECGNALRMYGYSANTPVHPTFVASSVTEMVVAFVLLVVLGTTFGEPGIYIAVAVAVIAIFLIFREPLDRAKDENIARFGRYYCEKCYNHFEGESLRQLTHDAKAKDAI